MSIVPIPDTPVQEKYPIRIYDENLDWVAEYPEYNQLVWIRRWRKPGEFTLNINRWNNDGTERVFSDMDLDTENWYVSIYRGGIARIARIDSAEITLNQTGRGGENWNLTGPDGKGILTDRQTVAGISAGTGYDVQSAVAAETAVRYYIDRNVINAKGPAGTADTNRGISQFILETADGLKGGNVSYQARLQPLTDDIEQILLASTGIGYEVEFLRAIKQFRVAVVAGTDRTASVQFNDQLLNIQNITFKQNRSGVRNLMYVGGTGTGASRTIVSVPASSPPTGLLRREDFIDGSTTDNSTDQLTALGNARITDIGSSKTMTFEKLPDNSFAYMTRNAAGDFDLGDLIKVVYSGISTMTGRIIEVKETYGGSGYPLHLEMAVGTEISDDVKIIRSINKKVATGARK